MNKFIFLFLIGFFLSLNNSLLSQNDKFFVGDLSLDEIEGPWVVIKLNWRFKETNIVVLHGQACLKGIGLVYNEQELIECVGLKNSDEELLKITHYTEALNLMERNGFTLSVISPRDNFEHEATQFIFRRGEHEPITIDRKREKP